MVDRLTVEVSPPLSSPTDDDVDEIVELQRLTDAELQPDDPPVTFAEVAGLLRVPLPDHRTRTWVARSAGVVVGVLTTVMDTRPANAGFVETETLVVRPGQRRRGVGTALFRAAVPDLVGEGAATMMWWPHEATGRRFIERLGFTHRQVERQSRLAVETVDDAQQDDWIAAPRARKAGYRLVTWSGPAPEELVTAYAAAEDAMADAPLDDVEWGHEPVTPAWIRAVEAVDADRGVLRYAALALSAQGEAAGMTLIKLHPHRPQLGQQQDTAVVPAHRGYGLGRWLKAANLRIVRAAHPELRIVETYNAESNSPMLDINVAMGFRPFRHLHAYQASVSAVAAHPLIG